MNRFENCTVEPFVGGLQVHSFIFENGLTVKIVPDHGAPVVAFQTWYGVGSADEEMGKTGLAHLFEHMMFKGTDVYEEGEFSARLEALGANGLNAWTWLDQTVFVQSVPVAQLETVADLESTRMKRLVVDVEAFTSELEVVTNERRLVVDNSPEGLLSERLFAKAFDKHPYGWPTVGWMKDLERLQPEDARAFYGRFYAPNNATIYLVGDVNPGEAAALIHRYYGGIPRSEFDRPVREIEPSQTRSKREDLTLSMSSDRVLIGFKVPEYTHDDIPALLVLDAALTAGRTGRLQRSLRDGGWVVDVSSYIMPLKDPSLWEFSLQCRAGLDGRDVEQAFWEEIRRVVEAGVSEGEVRMGVAQWRSYTWSQMVGVEGKADFLGWLCTHTGSHLDGLKRISAIEEVTPEAVRQVAKKWLMEDRATVVTGSADDDEGAADIPVGSAVKPVARIDVPAREMQAADWTNGMEWEELVCGANVLYAYDGTLPLVYFRIKLRCSSAMDPEDLPGLALVTGMMLTRGTETHSREHFQAALEQLGASMSAAVDSDAVTIWGSCLSDNWPALVALVAEALERPRFDSEDLALLVEELADDIRALVDDDEELVDVALRRALYGSKHPYGRDPRGTIASLKAMTVEDVAAFYSDNMKCGGALVGVVGAFDSAIATDIETILRGLQGEPMVSSQEWDTVNLEAPSVLFVDKPNRSQCQVRMAMRGLRRSSEDFPSFLLGNDCFGVGFQSRLMQEIRVKNGWSYFAYSAPGLSLRDTGWSVGFAPGNEHAGEAVARGLSLLQEARAEGFLETEVEQMRQARLQGWPFVVDTALKRLDLRMRKHWLDYDRLDATERMKTVTPQEVGDAFAGFLNRPLTTVVLGTWSEVGEALAPVLGEDITRVDYRDLIPGGNG